MALARWSLWLGLYALALIAFVWFLVQRRAGKDSRRASSFYVWAFLELVVFANIFAGGGALRGLPLWYECLTFGGLVALGVAYGFQLLHETRQQRSHSPRRDREPR